MALRTAPIVAGSLIGGYLVARRTKVRPLGGAVLAAGGIAAGRQWLRTSGPATTAVLTGIYLGLWFDPKPVLGLASLLGGVDARLQAREVQHREAHVGKADALGLLVRRPRQHDDAVVGRAHRPHGGAAQVLQALPRLHRNGRRDAQP